MYYLFTFSAYYPEGGMNDYIGAYSTAEEAKEVAISTSAEYWHIASVDASGKLVTVDSGGKGYM